MFRCHDCGRQHHINETIRQRRERNAALWATRKCKWCQEPFTPVQGLTGGAPPLKCPTCQSTPHRKKVPFAPCSRCGCVMTSRKKWCDTCRVAVHEERRQAAMKPPVICTRCGEISLNRKEVCSPCGKAARRREAARLRNFRERLFTTLVYTPEDVDFILDLLDSPCVYCGSKEKITIEHAVPLIRGGVHDRSNLVAACFSCNAAKGAMTPEEFSA